MFWIAELPDGSSVWEHELSESLKRRCRRPALYRIDPSPDDATDRVERLSRSFDDLDER